MVLRVLSCILLLLALLPSSPAAAVPATYAYDAAGRLAMEWVGNMRVEYEYDAGGNLMSQTSCVADCYIDGECWLQGDRDPSGACAACDAASRTAWTPLTDCTNPDMGVGADMGEAPDAGPMRPDAGADMGSEPDLGVGDTGNNGNTGNTGDSGGPTGGLDTDKGGCSCSVGRSGSADAWPLLLFGLYFGRRRKRRRGDKRRTLTFLGGLAGLFVGISSAQAVTVCQDGSCDYTTIGEGITNASNGETISVKPGVYRESYLSLNFGKNLVSTTPNDPNGVIIDAERNAAVIRGASNVMIRGVTLRNGYATGAPGGGIRITGGRVVLQNVIIENNESASVGGGIGTNNGVDLVLIDSIVRNNKSVNTGGGIGGGFHSLVVAGCTIQNNQAIGNTSAAGGGLDGRSSTYGAVYLEIRDSSFEGNKAIGGNGAEGGGLRTRTPVTIIRNTSFTGNSAEGTGATYGGALALGSGASVELENVTATGNNAKKGGGLYLGSGSGRVVVAGGAISGNTAAAVGDGGGFYCSAPSRLAGYSATASGNTPDDLAGSCFGVCTAAATQSCTTPQAGVCGPGQQVCDADGNWGLCTPITMAAATEMMCSDGLDEDCDGKVDASDPDCQPARPATRAQVGGSGRKGDPVNTFTGELYTQLAPDLDLGGPLPVTFRRYYASGLDALGRSGRLGTNWRHNFEWSLVDSGTTVSITDSEGRVIDFEQVGLDWVLAGFDDVSFQLTEQSTGFELYDPRTSRFYGFDSAGALVEISDGTNNRLTLTYVTGDLHEVSDGLGRTLLFTYDAGGLIDTISDGVRTMSFAHAGSTLTAVIDVLSNTTNYAYTATGLMTAATLPAGNTPNTQTFDVDGRVASQVDAGGTTSFAYDDVAGTCTITDAASSTVVHTHDLRGRLQQVQHASGETSTFGYDGAGRRTAVTDGGATSRTSFDSESDQPTSRTLPDGLMITYDLGQRFARGAFHSQIEGVHYPDGTSELLDYDTEGNLLSIVDRSGNTASFTYNDRGQTLSATNQAGGMTTYTYDAAGLLVSESDENGNATVYAYDGLFRRTGTTFADGATRIVTYDAADRVTSITNERGTLLTYGYDANGNLTSSTDGEGNVTTLAWDALDRFDSYTDAIGNTASVSYDALGRIDSQATRNGGVTSFERDADGRITAMVDASGARWTRTYQNGWLASLSDPLGNTVSYDRDSAGRITAIHSPLGNDVQFAFDLMGRPTDVTDPLGRVTSYGYDARGFLSSVARPGGLTASYTRDELGQVTTVTDQTGSSWAFEWDSARRLLSRSDPLGNQITRTSFDARDRPVGFTLPGGLGTVTLTYDGFGNLTAQDYSDGTSLNFTYDGRNLLTATSRLILGYDENGLVTSSNGISSTRDAGGRLETVSYPAGDVTYLYDSADNLLRIDDWLGNTTTFAYDAAGRQTEVSRANGVTTTLTWDADNNVVGIAEATSSTALSTVSLQRDALGNTIASTRDVPAPPVVPTSDVAFTFDAASQINSFAYDALGRRTSDDARTYSWDAASRLQGYTEGGTTVSFTHDGLLQVTGRTEGTTNDRYIWNYATTRRSLACIIRNGADLRYYVHSPDGELLYSIDAGSNAVRYYHFDEVGNTLFLTDDSGAITDTYGYTAYGELTTATGTSENPLTFGGRYDVLRDGASGLYVMGRRFYDSRTKRFISREPVIELSQPGLVNPYAYATGNPLRYIDPTGESGEDTSKGQPTPEGVKTSLKANKAVTALVGKHLDESIERFSSVADAATGANNLNKVWGKKNPQWVTSALEHSKKLQKYKGVADGFGKAGKVLGLAAAGREDGVQALAEFGAGELGEKLAGKYGGAIIGVGIEGYKTKQRVDKVQSELKTDQWSNVQNYYRALDNTRESYKAKLITFEEYERRAVAATQTFDMSTGGSKDSGVFGILHESAKGLNDMLWNLVGL